MEERNERAGRGRQVERESGPEQGERGETLRLAADKREGNDAAKRVADPMHPGSAGMVEHGGHVIGQDRDGKAGGVEALGGRRVTVATQIGHQDAVAQAREMNRIGLELAAIGGQAMAEDHDRPGSRTQRAIGQTRSVSGEHDLPHPAQPATTVM